MPARPLSRKSTIDVWVPTATRSSAPWSIGEQHGDVLARARRFEDEVVESEIVEPLGAGRPTVGVGVHDERGAAAQRTLGHRVEVADDHVGLQAELEQRVGAAVDTDEERSLLAHVAGAAEQVEVLAVVVTPHDDQDVTAAEVEPEVGDVEAAPREQVGFLPDEGDGVLDELLERGPDVALGLLVGGLEAGEGLARPRRDDFAVDAPDRRRRGSRRRRRRRGRAPRCRRRRAAGSRRRRRAVARRSGTSPTASGRR